MIDRESFLWSYLQPELKELLNDGELLVLKAKETALHSQINDFSFLVFPFAKAYEGFLKKLFLDLGMINYDEYYGDDIRIGRLLNPHYRHENQNLFQKLCNHKPEGTHLSKRLWETWKNGRNLIFHYFPHNFKRLDYQHAVYQIDQIVSAMGAAVVGCNLDKK
jgi:hypothetical protein